MEFEIKLQTTLLLLKEVSGVLLVNGVFKYLLNERERGREKREGEGESKNEKKKKKTVKTWMM